MPLIKVYKNYGNTYEEAIDFLGRSGTLLSRVGGDRVGQAEIMVNGDPIKIYAKGHEGQEIEAGKHISVIDEAPDKRFYYVKPEIKIS